MTKSRLQTIFESEAGSKLSLAEQKLLSIERSSTPAQDLEEIFRCIHSVKGAASVVQNTLAVEQSHILEEQIENYKKEATIPSSQQVSQLLLAVDQLRAACFPDKASPQAPSQQVVPESSLQKTASSTVDVETKARENKNVSQSVELNSTLSLSSDLIHQILALSGDNLVGWRAASRLTTNLHTHLRRLLRKASGVSGQSVQAQESNMDLGSEILEIIRKVIELDEHILQGASQGLRLYHKTLESRLRPFNYSTSGWLRLVRDLSGKLQKKVRLNVFGANNLVDRELLQSLESPITHLIRNAVDHGIEGPEERISKGKNELGALSIHIESFSNRLRISVQDDGRGINRTKIMERALEKGLSTRDLLEKMTDEEISQFVFLPGFSTKSDITDISGRGVGLDVVHTEVLKLGGSVSLTWLEGKKTTFTLEVTHQQSLVRSLLFRVCGELYAIPLVATAEIVSCEWSDVIRTQGHLYVDIRGMLVPVVFASEILDCKDQTHQAASLSLILLKDTNSFMALAVDSLEWQEDVSLQGIDPRLGTIPNVRGAAITEAGELAIVLDERQLETSILRFLENGTSVASKSLKKYTEKVEEKSVLVIDDSVTVRELERKILLNRGYLVDVANDGAEGLKMARSGSYDLIITDVDMPEMTGIELVTLLKQDPTLSTLPIIIVSYKDREEDRKRGLTAGADAYLTKSSFHDESFVQTVVDLVGEPHG